MKQRRKAVWAVDASYPSHPWQEQPSTHYQQQARVEQISVFAQTTNLALNKPVTCSAVENATYPCSAAVDGSTTKVNPLWQVDDGLVLNLLPTWAPDAATRKKILVDNSARLYEF